MAKIVPIVEGPGEIKVVPILLWKILQEMDRWDIQIAEPKNARGCSNLIRAEGLERFVELAWRETGCAAVLVLVDADETCPIDIAANFRRRISAIGVQRFVGIVVAKCEYEAWFLASLETIAGHNIADKPGLSVGLSYSGDVEERRGVKEWLSHQFQKGRTYKETEDQAPMTRLLDTKLARERSRSFRRLWHAMEEIVEAIDSGRAIVTPEIHD